MRFLNLSPYSDIGANCYLLEMGETRFILDAGTHPKHVGLATLPRFRDLAPNSVDAIFISHPHLDHIGALPCLSDYFPEASVVMSEGTKQAGRALLHNSVNVMMALGRELNEPSYPLYNHRQIDRQCRTWQTRALQHPFFLGNTDRVQCEFYHAGHVMGAVGIRFSWRDRHVFFTGDVHFENQTLTTAARFPESGIDDLIIESTRGDFCRRNDYTRESEKRRFGELIAETIGRGGAVFIPVFAFGKTQEVLLMLRELRDEGVIPVGPVHIGGLSCKMTAITDESSGWLHRQHQNYKILEQFEGLQVMPKGVTEPKREPGSIYTLSSGMMSENTVSNRFGRQVLSSPRDTLIFVGYADPESPAGRIQNTPRGERVVLDEAKGWDAVVKCQVEKFDFSGHAPREEIVDYAVKVAPRRVILVHGVESARNWFRNELQNRLPGCEVVIPRPGQSIDLV